MLLVLLRTLKIIFPFIVICGKHQLLINSFICYILTPFSSLCTPLSSFLLPPFTLQIHCPPLSLHLKLALMALMDINQTWHNNKFQ